MKIGAVEIPALARLAPMAGITNAPFRLIARECGSGLTTSEEMDAAALLTGHPFADAIAAYYPAERPLAMQLLGKDPDLLARAAERCQVLGADIVDLNMGCPMPKITGKAPWAIIREVVESVSVPVTGNGDVHSMAEARRMVAETGCASVMIGRGALGSPWIFDESFETLPREAQRDLKARVIARHVSLIREHFREKYALIQMKKHLAWYTEGLGHATECRARIFQTRSPEEVWEVFESYWTSTHRAVVA